MSACKDCKFFVENPALSGAPAHSGTCRLDPPSAVAIPAQGGVTIASMWPQVAADGWCSHFEVLTGGNGNAIQ